jgi:hypothetical protein
MAFVVIPWLHWGCVYAWLALACCISTLQHGAFLAIALIIGVYHLFVHLTVIHTSQTSNHFIIIIITIIIIKDMSGRSNGQIFYLTPKPVMTFHMPSESTEYSPM